MQSVVLVNILALSDSVDDRVYSEQFHKSYADVDLVLGCGDLPIYYLEFVADALDKPVLYVRGNHDTEAELSSVGEWRHWQQSLELLEKSQWA